jgi:integrase
MMRANVPKLRRKLMRTRHQNGWVEETRARTWRAHWYEYIRDPETGTERRQHRSRVLGEKSKMRKFEAEAELLKIVSPLNATQSSRRDDRVPLRWFVEHRWRPTVEGGWAPTTRKTNEHLIEVILGQFGDRSLRELDKVELQDWLNQLSRVRSRSIVFHCHTFLKSICGEAVEQDFLLKDPSRKLKRPKTRKPDETILEWSQYQAVIDAARTLRDKLAIKVGSGTAVRPGELFAFRWRSLEQLPNGRHALRVKETVYKGKLRPWAKTEGSEDYVPLPKRLTVELIEWRTLTTLSGPEDFIFSNSRGGFLDYENFEARVLDPIRLQLGLPKLNFQILRRTFATLAVGERKGTLKDVQKQLRHTRPDTTLENYVKDIPDSVYAMVDAMYEGIAGPDEKQILAVAPAAGGVQ